MRTNTLTKWQFAFVKNSIDIILTLLSAFTAVAVFLLMLMGFAMSVKYLGLRHLDVSSWYILLLGSAGAGLSFAVPLYWLSSKIDSDLITLYNQDNIKKIVRKKKTRIGG